MFLATPNQLEHEHPGRRRVALGLTAFVSAANIFSLGALTHFLLHHSTPNARELIVAGVLIWLTNFLIFALWYWELDRGGPGKRAAGHDGPPDFLFPQMTDDRIEPLDWRPQFIDYLYVSLTNNTAFSPTDTMPLTPMAKIIMGVQSVVSLLTIGLIVSRAVNILGASVDDFGRSAAVGQALAAVCYSAPRSARSQAPVRAGLARRRRRPVPARARAP